MSKLSCIILVLEMFCSGQDLIESSGKSSEALHWTTEPIIAVALSNLDAFASTSMYSETSNIRSRFASTLDIRNESSDDLIDTNRFENSNISFSPNSRSVWINASFSLASELGDTSLSERDKSSLQTAPTIFTSFNLIDGTGIQSAKTTSTPTAQLPDDEYLSDSPLSRTASNTEADISAALSSNQNEARGTVPSDSMNGMSSSQTTAAVGAVTFSGYLARLEFQTMETVVSSMLLNSKHRPPRSKIEAKPPFIVNGAEENRTTVAAAFASFPVSAAKGTEVSRGSNAVPDSTEINGGARDDSTAAAAVAAGKATAIAPVSTTADGGEIAAAEDRQAQIPPPGEGSSAAESTAARFAVSATAGTTVFNVVGGAVTAGNPADAVKASSPPDSGSTAQVMSTQFMARCPHNLCLRQDRCRRSRGQIAATLRRRRSQRRRPPK